MKCPSSSRRGDLSNYGFYNVMGYRPLAAINVPADTVVFCDVADVGGSADPNDPTKWTEVGGADWEVDYVGAWDTGWGTGWNTRRAIGRHNGQTNVAFADGHVKSVPVQKLIGPLPNGYPLQDPNNLWDNY
jgi:prepilin-type processing-associated H-X9-DG protein